MPATEIDYSRFTLRDDLPPRRQVAAFLKALIALGQLAPGGQVPAVSSLAARLRVSAGEVRRAYGELEEQGFIVSREGAWTVSDDRRPGAPSAPTDPIRERLEEVIVEARQAGVSRAALLHLFTSLLARQV